MDEDFEHPGVAVPDKIDIYVDGSWLTRGKRNPIETGGWGAVVVETYPDHEVAWSPSGPTSRRVASSYDAEYEGAYCALLAVQERECRRPAGAGENGRPPKITLHSDVNLPDRSSKRSGADENSNGLQGELRALLQRMDVSVVWSRHDKSGKKTGNGNYPPEMAEAHNLASKAAWARRMKLQGTAHKNGRDPS